MKYFRKVIEEACQRVKTEGVTIPTNKVTITRTALANIIDHTFLKPDATSDDILRVCEEAKKFHFYSVCVNPYWVPLCMEELQDSAVLVCTVAGFPLGSSTTDTKVLETEEAVANGAQEIDMVMNIGKLKEADYSFVYEDIQHVINAAGNAKVKVIIETCLLKDQEKVAACVLAKEAGAHFVKTSTGFSTAGATQKDVALMRSVVGSDIGVKAAGGIRDYQTAISMIHAGASRIGASSSVIIVTE